MKTKSSNLFTRLVKSVDQFAQPVSIEYNRRTAHPTMGGGIISLLFICSIWGYTAWRVALLTGRDRDEYFTSSKFTDHELTMLNLTKEAISFKI